MPGKATLIALTFALATSAVSAQRPAERLPDLQGFWSSGTVTPLQRPADLAGKPFLSEPEAAEFERTWLENFRKNFPPEDLQAPDLDYDYMDRMHVVADRRTSLIVDPADGRLPALLPAAKERAAARPKSSHDDPELLGLDERCLLETAFGSSNASPPMVPNPFGQNIYQIVQTRNHVMIFTEVVHDARIVRVGGTHAPPQVQLWLGDSIGRWEGDTLVVDTTNFSEKTHFRNSGPRLHVVERFTRTGPATIRYRVTVEDPETWAQPWTAEIPFTATGERIRSRVVERSSCSRRAECASIGLICSLTTGRNWSSRFTAARERTSAPSPAI
jgi:hypothetical protein